MYGGTDKLGGALVGAAAQLHGGGGAGGEADDAAGGGGADGHDLADAALTAAAGETLVVAGEGSTKVMLQAVLDMAGGGGLRWERVADEGAAYKAAVAGSQMASMLKDGDRNAAYAVAINAAVSAFKDSHDGKGPVVLDIGAGTGLLAMLAARAGAARVYACEQFSQMAAIAEANAAANGFGDIIKVIPKMSSDVTVGAGGEHDMESRADIVVSEILDSAVLGEGVLPSLRHAFEHLLVSGAAAVPAKAELYAELVESSEVAAMHDVSELGLFSGGDSAAESSEPEFLLTGGGSAGRCPGGRVALPMHTDRLSSFKRLSEPFVAFEFDFTSAAPVFEPYVSRELSVPVVQSGKATAVHCWWDLEVWPGVHYCIKPGAVNWQDHWLQVMAPLGRSPVLTADGDSAKVLACHNDLNLWFDAVSNVPPAPPADDASIAKKRRVQTLNGDPQPCMCGLHTLFNAQRLWMMSDQAHLRKWQTALRGALSALRKRSGDDAALFAMDVSDGYTCAVIAAAMRDSKLEIASIEEKPFGRVVAADVFRGQKLGDFASAWGCRVCDVDGEMLDGCPVDLLMSEVFYLQMQQKPLWQAFNFWAQVEWFKSKDLLSEHAAIVPAQAFIYAAVVEFADLCRSHGSVGSPCGFSHAALDEAAVGWEEQDFVYPMWQFKHRLLSPPCELLSLDFVNSRVGALASAVSMPITTPGTVHGVVMWVDYRLGEGTSADDPRTVVSTRPTEQPSAFSHMVKFLPGAWDRPIADVSMSSKVAVSATATFDDKAGALQTSFKLEPAE